MIGLDPSELAADVLDDVAAHFRRYVAFSSEAAVIAVTLWAIHTHTRDAFDSTPRLAVLSPAKGSGKTRMLELLDGLVPGPMFTANTTSAALFRKIASSQTTVLMDEADTYFGYKTAANHEELRGLINAGHRRGAVAYRCVGEKQEVRAFPAYAPVALAGIGFLPDTVMDRSVVIMMKRRAPGEAVDQFRQRIVGPAAAELHRRIAEWADEHLDELKLADPAMPDGIIDRPADVWEPLLAIADAAGGDWPVMARAAAVELNAARTEADPSLGVRLLADLRNVFDAADIDRLSTDTLLDRLCDIDESPWGDLRGKRLDARGLAKRLGPYGPRPKVIRVGATTPRGYERADLEDAWTRYLPPCATSATSATEQVTPVADASSVADGSATSDGRATPPTSDVALVAVVAGVEPMLRDACLANVGDGTGSSQPAGDRYWRVVL